MNYKDSICIIKVISYIWTPVYGYTSVTLLSPLCDSVDSVSDVYVPLPLSLTASPDVAAEDAERVCYDQPGPGPGHHRPAERTVEPGHHPQTEGVSHAGVIPLHDG